MGLELIFNRLPIRFFHFIFPVCYGLMFILANYLSHMVKRGIETSDLTIKDHHAQIVDWKDNKGKGLSHFQVHYWRIIFKYVIFRAIWNPWKGFRAESGELLELGSIELLVIFFVGGTFIVHFFAWCWSQVKMSQCTRKHRPATIFEHQLYNYY